MLKKEGFALQEPSTWESLRNFFHYQFPSVDANNAIPVTMSPGVAQILPAIDGAMETPGFPKDVQSLTRLFYDDTNPEKAEDAKCRALAHPKWLTANRANRSAEQIREGKGCGWWFVADPNIPSVAAFGTQPQAIPGKAPVVGTALYSANLPPQGRWIWDVEEAERFETIKRCKAIATCSLLSGSTERCGFCPSKGWAVPLDESGSVRYTQDDNGNCADSSRMVRDANQCHLLTIPPQAYSGDFDYDMNGNAIRNEKYFALTNPQGLAVRDPCELENGYLTKECRLNMCRELAHAQVGKGIHRIVNQEGNLSETDQIALFYLKKYAAIEIPATFWLPAGTPAPTNEKPLRKSDAEDLMQRLYTAATSGPPSRSRAAALWFLNETPFNVCDFEDADQETFPLQCIQREFRKAGCQAAGTAYPATVDPFQKLTYGQIKVQFRDLYAKMKDVTVKNVREQDDAIERCLGIEIQRATDETYELNPNVCREQGIEYWFTTIPTIGQRLMYARVVTDVAQLVDESTPLGAEFKKILNAKTGVRGFTARTYVDLSGTGVTVQFEPPRDRATFYSLWVNGRPVLARVESGVYTASLPPFQRSEIEVRYEGTGADLGFGAPRLTFTPNTPLYLSQSSWKPAVALRATKEGWVDDNRYIQFSTRAETKQHAGRWGVVLEGLALQSVPERGLWFSSIRTVAGMFAWTGLAPQTPLWQFDQGNGGLSDTVMKLAILEQRLVFTISSGTSIFQIRSQPLPTAHGWVHVAVVLDESFVLSRIYVNGRDSTGPDPKANGTFYPENEAFTRIVLGGAGFQGSIAWFHVYDKPLGSAEIARDKEYDNPLYSDKEAQGRIRGPRVANGWPMRST